MKVGIFSTAAMIGALSLAASANAAVFITSAPGAPDPGPAVNENQVITFDPTGAAPAGVTLTGDYEIVQGSLSGKYATPALDTSYYLTVPFDSRSGIATMDFAAFLGNKDVAQFSFYWGSIDTYNTLQLVNRAGVVTKTITGSMLPPATGDQGAAATNRRLTFTLTGADQDLGALRFTSIGYAFETDTFAFAIAGIPEPSTWGLMIMGFGGAGAMLRSRRRALTA